MEQYLLDLITYRLERAREELANSEIIFAAGLVRKTYNCSYYAIFHAIRAVLAKDEFDSKKHSGVIAYFNKNYFSTGILERKFSAYVYQAFEMRNENDYKDFVEIDQDKALVVFEHAKEFVDAVEKLLTETAITGV